MAKKKDEQKDKIKELIAKLKDKDKAACAPGEEDDKKAVPALIEVLLKNKVGGLRMFAAKELGNIGDKRAVPALMEALKDEDGDVRKAAKEALEKIKSKQKRKTRKDLK